MLHSKSPTSPGSLLELFPDEHDGFGGADADFVDSPDSPKRRDISLMIALGLDFQILIGKVNCQRDRKSVV